MTKCPFCAGFVFVRKIEEDGTAKMPVPHIESSQTMLIERVAGGRAYCISYHLGNCKALIPLEERT